jgi:hypothetical protein
MGALQDMFQQIAAALGLGGPVAPQPGQSAATIENILADNYNFFTDFEYTISNSAPEAQIDTWLALDKNDPKKLTYSLLSEMGAAIQDPQPESSNSKKRTEQFIKDLARFHQINISGTELWPSADTEKSAFEKVAHILEPIDALAEEIAAAARAQGKAWVTKEHILEVLHIFNQTTPADANSILFQQCVTKHKEQDRDVLKTQYASAEGPTNEVPDIFTFNAKTCQLDYAVYFRTFSDEETSTLSPSMPANIGLHVSTKIDFTLFSDEPGKMLDDAITQHVRFECMDPMQQIGVAKTMCESIKSSAVPEVIFEPAGPQANINVGYVDGKPIEFPGWEAWWEQQAPGSIAALAILRAPTNLVKSIRSSVSSTSAMLSINQNSSPNISTLAPLDARLQAYTFTQNEIAQNAIDIYTANEYVGTLQSMQPEDQFDAVNRFSYRADKTYESLRFFFILTQQEIARAIAEAGPAADAAAIRAEFSLEAPRIDELNPDSMAAIAQFWRAYAEVFGADQTHGASFVNSYLAIDTAPNSKFAQGTRQLFAQAELQLIPGNSQLNTAMVSNLRDHLAQKSSVNSYILSPHAAQRRSIAWLVSNKNPAVENQPPNPRPPGQHPDSGLS